MLLKKQNLNVKAYCLLSFLALNAMGRLLRKELLRVTIIQKVNENKKKAPQLERSCSAFLYISILFVYFSNNLNTIS